MYYFFLILRFVRSAATNNAKHAATIMYALNGIILYPIVAIKPDTIITITFFCFFKIIN